MKRGLNSKPSTNSSNKLRSSSPLMNDLITVKSFKKPGSSFEKTRDEDEFHHYSESKLRQSVSQTMMHMTKYNKNEDNKTIASNNSSMVLQSAIKASTGQFQPAKGFKPKSEIKSELEESYIQQLQQQLKILETELEVQKKLSTEHEKRLNQKTEPLEDSFHHLKLKFIEKEKENQQSVETLKSEVVEKQNEIFKFKEKYKKWKEKYLQEKENTKIEIRRLHEKYIPEVVKLEKQVDALNVKVKQEQNDNERKNVEIKNYLKEISEIGPKIEELQLQKEKLEKQIPSISEEIIQLKKELFSLAAEKEENKKEIEILKGKSAKYEKEWENSVNQLKRKDLEIKQLELDKEQLTSERDMIKGQLKSLSQKYNELETTHTKNQAKLNEAQWALTKEKQTFDNLLKEKTNYEKETESNQREYKELKLKMEELKKRHEEQQKILHEKEYQINSFLQTELGSWKIKYKTLEDNNTELVRQNEQLRVENRNYLEEVDKLKEYQKYYENERVQYEKNELEWKVLIRKLKHQLKLSLAVQQLDKQGLSSLMNTNMNVAQSINTLMSIIKEGNQIKEEETTKEEKQSPKNILKSSTTKWNSFDEWIKDKKR
ncbi:hypothetical protein ABK040_010792 [Willaertia magna]